MHKRVRHEKLAAAGFIIVLIIALGAFYYIWKTQIQFGRTIEGLRSFACSQWAKENKKPVSECPDIKLIQPETALCCCSTGSSGKFNKYEARVIVPKNSGEQAIIPVCNDKCSQGGSKSYLVNAGNCQWIETPENVS